MEVKKNPSKDVHRMRGVFFLLSLTISLAMVAIAFEWKTEMRKAALRNVDEGSINEIPIIPITNQVDPEPPTPVKNEIILTKYLDQNKIVEVKNGSTIENNQAPYIVEPQPIGNVGYQPVEDSAEYTDVPFILVEKDAEPIGGYDAFYKTLAKILKYPKPAIRNEVQGKVYVEFVVNRDGTPADLKVVRGIGFGCDDEAILAIAATKWNPGKQRGRPVRQRMTLAVVFKID